MIIKNILLQNDSGGPNSTITTTTKLSFTFTCMIVNLENVLHKFVQKMLKREDKYDAIVLAEIVGDIDMNRFEKFPSKRKYLDTPS
ncbi:hypothetical protein DERP_010404 [Dermatophagoides pteronyssinus]|uniref:Uncharacterized protein n=1 Tax=Dermatophagoides pteronyssinus TaxID=6956 RepID=A0ABQ8J4X2_DERPT|nr:hypothetical protein DERP_010404 [Dermatophagoides pteronyssinus]